MDFGYLFTSFEGRISRKHYWLGVLILIALAIVVMFILFLAGLLVAGTAGSFVAFVIQLAFLYPSTALMVKRLHDRNRPGWFAAFILIPLVVKGLTDLLGITGNPDGMYVIDFLLGVTIFLVSLWFFIELGCMRGTIGENRYGPDPVGPKPAMH